MAKQIFVIGIGGTGMRCIESFTHLCAMGMFDDTDVHMLALDTDKENGNFTRLKNLKEAYIKTKGINKDHQALKDTFFSANILYYQFSPDYQKTSTFNSIHKYTTKKEKNPLETDLANIFLTEKTREFDLKHGFRAQTHLGSMLMYHSIIDEIKSNSKGDLFKYVANLKNASTTGKPRVFILGSVFGGTGASSIPIIPKALIKGAEIVSAGAVNLDKNAFFGATLLTGYFSFNTPSQQERDIQKVIATSDKFALNSQAAMMFYEADDTVKKTYQKFYMLGTKNIDWNPSKNPEKTITGGEDQENKSHYIELLAAFAAWDFFNLPEEELVDFKKENKLDYLFRTLDDSISFVDFVGDSKKAELAKKFGLFVALSLIAELEGHYDFFQQVQSGGLISVGITGYEDIDKKEIDNLKKYINLFHFEFNGNEVKDGWLRQLNKSTGSNAFLFNTDLFSCDSKKAFEKFDLNKKIYPANGEFEKKRFSTRIGFGNMIFTKFFEEFIKTPEPNIVNKCEKLIKRTYDTLVKLYNF